MSKEYFFKISILNRKNSNPLESISYYSGEDQHDLSSNKEYTSNRKDHVVWNTIAIPEKDENFKSYNNLPEYLKLRNYKKDLVANARNILWHNVYKREIREDAQFARLFELALPDFLNAQQAQELVLNFGKILVKDGMIADCSVHGREKVTTPSFLEKIKNDFSTEEESKDFTDFRGYIVCTLREYKEGRFENKNRDWNSRKKMDDWRKEWVGLLREAVINANLTEEELINWNKKLSIYSEYKEVDFIELTINKQHTSKLKP